MSAYQNLPSWLRTAVSVLVLPITIGFCVCAMWKNETCTRVQRVVVSALGILLVIGIFGATYAGANVATRARAGSEPAAASVSARMELDAAPRSLNRADTEVIPGANVDDLPVATITRVLDGDTVEARFADTEGPVRLQLIGVDAPADQRDTEPFAWATAYTEQFLLGRSVYVETDVEPWDERGRLLVYIWLSAPKTVSEFWVRSELFNARIVRDGFAQALTLPPNHRYAEYIADSADGDRAQQVESRAIVAGLVQAATTPLGGTSLLLVDSQSELVAGYIGNRRTGKFHRSGCSWVGKMNARNKVPYAAREYCVVDGYVPCKTCEP